MLECEKAKIALNQESEVEQYQVCVPQFAGDFDLDISITQEGLNTLVTPYLQQRLQPCLDDVLK